MPISKYDSRPGNARHDWRRHQRRVVYRNPPKELTKNDIKILECVADNMLKNWRSMLNNWGWPDDMPYPEGGYVPNGRRVNIIKWINDKVGKD